jgi:hypothetical protein
MVPFTAGGNAKCYYHWKIAWQFLIKINTFFKPYDPAIVLFGIYSNELKMCTNTEIFRRIFIATLFIIDKIWKQPRCLQ